MREATWTDASPLYWPEGWPRTKSYDRKGVKFHATRRVSRTGNDGSNLSYNEKKSLSIEEAIWRIKTELGKLEVDWETVIVSTNRPTRRDGLPRGDVGEPSDPGVAIYWFEPGRGKQAQSCMAVDVYNTVAGNLAAVAATLDAMRAIERHGGAQILKRAFAGFKALPASTAPAMNAEMAARAVLARADMGPAVMVGGVLGVPATARDAIRRAAARTHPDVGGRADDFALVQEAKRVLEAHHGSPL